MSSVLDTIVWHEGLLLTPQHFQQSDRRSQLISKNLIASNPYFWGISKLKINEINLPSGVLLIDEVAGCFQDGFFFHYTVTESHVLSLDLSKMKDGQTSLIYLTIPTETPDGTIQQEGSPRFKSYAKNVVDLVTAEPAAAIFCFRPNLSLFMGDELSSLKLYMPIVKVSFQSGVYSLLSYDYPTTNVIGSSAGESANKLLRVLQEKSLLLSSSSNKLGNIYRYSSQALFMSISSDIPFLRAKLSSTVLHPFELYCLLNKTVGLIYAALYKPPVAFPTYDHCNIKKCLSDLVAAILSEVSVINAKHIAVPFSDAQDSYRVDMSEFDHSIILLGIKMKSYEYAEQISQWFFDAPVFSESFITQIKKNRIYGMKRKSISRNVEYDISENPTTLIYELSVSDKYYKNGEALCISNPPEKIAGLLDGLFLFILSKDS